MYELVGNSDTSTVCDPFSRRLFSNTQIFEFSNPSLLDVKPTQGAFACCLSHAHGYSPYIFQPLSEMGSTISKVTRT